MRRNRKAKIIATLGPASESHEKVEALFNAGADVFRLNFSHDSHESQGNRIRLIRQVEKKIGRPIGILMDLQGPKLRLGKFANGLIQLKVLDSFRLDLSDEPGDQTRAPLPHPEIFAALSPGTQLMINDGRVRLEVIECDSDYANTKVLIGGEINDRKGVNVPDVLLPLSAMTKKDHIDLEYGLEMGVDWIALSFVQRAKDVKELRELVGDKAAIIAKLEKPSALDELEEIIDASDAIMVARGDLGVELPPEKVPTIQKDICRACRKAGKPVIVATQMLDSMILSPIPTRAEVQDVAAAIYDGADAVMLSAETAAGNFPVEAATMMNKIVESIENDSHYRKISDTNHPDPENTTADAICSSLRHISNLLHTPVVITYTSSGSTSIRAARERPEAPILSLTPEQHIARRLGLVWGIHSVYIEKREREVSMNEVINTACKTAVKEGFAKEGQRVVITAGVPFGKSGSTNFLRIAKVWKHEITDENNEEIHIEDYDEETH